MKKLFLKAQKTYIGTAKKFKVLLSTNLAKEYTHTNRLSEQDNFYT